MHMCGASAQSQLSFLRRHLPCFYHRVSLTWCAPSKQGRPSHGCRHPPDSDPLTWELHVQAPHLSFVCPRTRTQDLMFLCEPSSQPAPQLFYKPQFVGLCDRLQTDFRQPRARESCGAGSQRGLLSFACKIPSKASAPPSLRPPHSCSLTKTQRFWPHGLLGENIHVTREA